MSPSAEEPRFPGIRARRLLWSLPLLLLLGAGTSPARAEYFTIGSFHADIVVHPDSSLSVTETIETFFSSRRHGIYRDIPFRYADEFGKKSTAPVRVVSVVDQFRKERPYRVTRVGDAVRIRIGRKGRFVDGRQVYVITYTVQNAILFLDSHDELYWNVTGNDWDTAIRSASARVAVEDGQGEMHIRGSCYTGRFGSRESSCTFLPLGKGGEFRTGSSLSPREGLTIALGWDKGIVRPPSSLRKTLWGLNPSENGILLLPIATLLFMLVHWYRRGKDPDVGPSIAVMYAPPEEDGRPLRPPEVGALSDERLDPKDITASIVDLAVRGIVTIREIRTAGFLFDRTDFLLEKVGEAKGDLPLFEKKLLAGLFPGGSREVHVSELKYSFYKNLEELKDAVFGRLQSLGYIRAHPGSVKGVYRGIGIGVGFVGGGLAAFFQGLTGADPGRAVAAFALSGLTVFLFAPVMPVKTRKGALALRQVKGFEEFLLRAEKDRLERMADQNLFEKYLPYAIALDVSDRWADAFEGISQQAPRWYSSTEDIGTFHPASFQRSLGNALATMGSAMYAAPRSSGGGASGGGGSSGGGGGGGGGGSW